MNLSLMTPKEKVAYWIKHAKKLAERRDADKQFYDANIVKALINLLEDAEKDRPVGPCSSSLCSWPACGCGSQ
jgi:hypothetical protein